jgi:membrane peptidoglycan carboxypeptidase
VHLTSYYLCIKMLKILKIILGCVSFIFLLSVIDGVSCFRRVDFPRGAIKFYDSDGELFYTYLQNSEGYQSNVSLESLPTHVLDATLSAEDSGFYDHFGIDLRGVLRAVVLNVRAGRVVSGGSTITQQVAKQNLSHTAAFLDRPVIKKLRQVNAAFYLELGFSKDAILEHYINNAYYGNNSYGVGAASLTYYGRPSTELSISEAATLAGVLRSPVALNPQYDIASSKARRDAVLNLMRNNGFLTDEELSHSLSVPASLNFTSRSSAYHHFVDYVFEEVFALLDISHKKELVGFSIHTTLDRGVSHLSHKAIQGHVGLLKEKHQLSTAGVVVIDVSTGSILSMLGSVDYFDETISGALNMTTLPRQPGSALKPVTYATAFHAGLLSPDSLIMDEKTTFVDAQGKSFVPHNYNGVFNGPVSARVALASSLNLPAVKVLDMVGVHAMISTAQRLGLHSLNDPDRYDLSVTLGGGEVTLLELTNGYASFSRGGAYMPVSSIRQISDSRDRKIYEYSPSAARPVWGTASNGVSNVIFNILSSPSDKVLGFGRNNVLNLPFPAASKTGTTTDWHDNWTLGYTKGTSQDYVVGIWVGNADMSPMHDIDGVTGAGPIWREIMLGVYQEFFGAAPYPTREGADFGDLPPERAPTTTTPAKTAVESLSVENALSGASNKITNPPPAGEYVILPHEQDFERIHLEISASSDVVSVDFYLDGAHLGTFYEKDSFKYLWCPKEGSHTLQADFKNSIGNIISKDRVDFVVHSP